MLLALLLIKISQQKNEAKTLHVYYFYLPISPHFVDLPTYVTAHA